MAADGTLMSICAKTNIWNFYKLRAKNPPLRQAPKRHTFSNPIFHIIFLDKLNRMYGQMQGVIKHIRHAAADVGLIFIAYNLKRLMALVSSEELKEVFGASLALFTGFFWLKTSSNGLLQSISNRWSPFSEICAFLLRWQLKQNQASLKWGCGTFKTNF